ncbi:MAG: signal peptidase II [Ignavibacteria bacterium]|nr:signal peptidase II [Ignavibacteria bacterium]
MKVLIVTFFIVLSDQLTKLYVKGIKIPMLGIDFQGMPYQSSKNVFGNFFKITFIENPGMAFGMQIGGKLFLSLFTIFATILLFLFLYKNRNESLLLRMSLALILGGAIGNLIDRVFYGRIYDYAPIFYGRVVDFLHFDFPNFTIFGKNIYSWPIFNIADISVTAGFLFILIGYKKIFNNEEQPDETEEDITLSPDETAGLNNTAVISGELIKYYQNESVNNATKPGSDNLKEFNEYMNSSGTTESDNENKSEVKLSEGTRNIITQIPDINEPDERNEKTG